MLKRITLIFIFLLLLFHHGQALAEITGDLNKDTFTIRLLGNLLNQSSALNIKFSFSDPDVAMLSSESPIFQANGAAQLLTSSNPSSNTISVVWDGYIPSNEASITFMLEKGSAMGITTFSIDKVESAYGIDITNNIAIITDKFSVSNSFGSETTSFGKFTLLDPGKLYTPGTAAIAVQAENISPNLTAKLNGKPVILLENNTGVAEIVLPENSNELNFTLEVNSGSEQRLINLGNVKLEKASTRRYPPIIDRAYVINKPGDNKLKVYGRYFGIGRFGRDGVNVEVIPGTSDISNENLRRRSAKDSLGNSDCIPAGSYVNISHPAGTVTKKIKVYGNCN